MTTFIRDDFLLQSTTARRLYEEYARNMPIFDYHCHLSPREIWENEPAADMTALWLGGDHYKWRLMRAHGVEERFITGGAEPYEKFLRWADTVSHSVGNPLYHWCQLELLRYFGVEELLTAESAPRIWETCNRLLASGAGRPRSLIVNSGVKALCTTDDPADDLCWHRALANDAAFPVQVLPTFRPDKAIHLQNPGAREWVEHLGVAAGRVIDSFDSLLAALADRAATFKAAGCRLSDHSFGSPDFTVRDAAKARTAFSRLLKGEPIPAEELAAYQTELMLELGRLYHRLDFSMQLHFGVVRNTNTRQFRVLGPDTGFDSIGDSLPAASLIALLDGLEVTGELPRTVLYTLNPADNAKFASVAGSFQSGPARGKVQCGAAWWFNDHLDGMLDQMKTLANTGLLSTFIGMLTDSRSFLSYTRHEYFRRILCDLLGGWAEQGLAPGDPAALGGMVQDICYNNAVRYFGLSV